MSSKLIEQIDKMSILELAGLVKELQEKYGITAAAPVAASGAQAGAPAAGAAAAEEKSEFKIILKDSGANKLNVIKALRSVTSFDLKKAKELAESASDSCVISEAASKEDTKKIKEALEAAGAKVVIS